MCFLRCRESRKEKRQNEESMYHFGLREASMTFRISPILRCRVHEAVGDLVCRVIAEYQFQPDSG